MEFDLAVNFYNISFGFVGKNYCRYSFFANIAGYKMYDELYNKNLLILLLYEIEANTILKQYSLCVWVCVCVCCAFLISGNDS